MKRLILLGALFLLTFQFQAAAQRKPVAYIIGDSTVKNGKGDGSNGLWGWGDLIVQLFDTTKIKVVNCALGGTSSRTFQTKGLWDKVREQLEHGDFVLIQFGHNDGGAVNDTSRARGTLKGVGEEYLEIANMLTEVHETVHTYGWYLRKMIHETQVKGAVPVVVTPIPRNDWDQGKLKRTPNSYPQWAMDVAKAEKVGWIDLNEMVSKTYDKAGMEQVKSYFPGDHTHTNLAGAQLNAELVVKGIQTLEKSRLKAYLKK